MPRHVALFRGINVGKAKRIAMAELRALLAQMGYGDVATLLNSGNAVFTARGTNGTTHANRIRAQLKERLHVDARVIVKSAADIAAIVAGNALAKLATQDSRMLVAFVQDARQLDSIRELGKGDWGKERVHVGDHAAYLWCANGILESKMAPALLGALGDAATTRNWATLRKLEALLGRAP